MDSTSKKSAGIPVEVCYVDPKNLLLIPVELPQDACLADAIRASGIEQRIGQKVREDRVGVYGKKGKFSTPLRAHDRVEIYCPLEISPQEARRMRLEKALGKKS